MVELKRHETTPVPRHTTLEFEEHWPTSVLMDHTKPYCDYVISHFGL